MLTDFTALRQHVRALGRRGSAGYPPELRGRLIAAARELRAARCSWETVADNLGVSVGYIVSPRRSRSHQVPGISSRPARAAWMAARRYSAGLTPRTFAVSTSV